MTFELFFFLLSHNILFRTRALSSIFIRPCPFVLTSEQRYAQVRDARDTRGEENLRFPWPRSLAEIKRSDISWFTLDSSPQATTRIARLRRTQPSPSIYHELNRQPTMKRKHSPDEDLIRIFHSYSHFPFFLLKYSVLFFFFSFSPNILRTLITRELI